MYKYIGTKLIEAEPQEKSVLVCKDGHNYPTIKEGYKVKYADGYEGWSPKDAFEKTYRKTDNMNFGLAVETSKKGYKVARKGWNGKGMFVVYQKGYPQGIKCNKQTAEAWGLNEGDLFKYEPYLQIRMVNGSHSMWTPSINDCLAEDWYVLEYLSQTAVNGIK